MGTAGVILSVLLPIWTLACFAIGVTMERGSFSFLPDRQAKKRVGVLEVHNQYLRNELDQASNETERWRKIAREYQEVYPKPPTAFDYVIKEESDRVAPSMSH